MDTAVSASRRNTIALLAMFALYGLAQASGEYRVLFLQAHGLTATECGRVLAAANLLAAVSRPLSGVLADKLRSRFRVYIGGAVVWLLMLALLLLTRNVRLASFALCAGVVPLLSLGDVITYGMMEAGGVNASMNNPRLDYGLIRACLSLGYCAINFLYAPIVDRFGPTAPFCCAMLFIAAMLLFCRSLRSYETPTARGGKMELGRIPGNYFLITFILLNFIYALGSNTTMYLTYLIDAVGLEPAALGTASGIRVVGELLIMPLLPHIKRRVSLPMLQAIACLLRIAEMLCFITCRNPTVIMCVIILSGLSGGITLGTSAVYLRLMAPEGLDTTTLSLHTGMTYLGAIVMSLLGGAVVDSLGIFSLYRIALIFLSVWIVLYFATWLFGKCALKKTPPAPMLLRRSEEKGQQ